MPNDRPLEALHDDGRKRNGARIIEAGKENFFGKGVILVVMKYVRPTVLLREML